MDVLNDALDRWQDTMEALPPDLALDHWKRLTIVEQAARSVTLLMKGTPMLLVHDWVSDPWCLNGWAGCTDNYTGGHHCERDYDHKGRCKCVCGATTTTVPPKATE